MSDVTEDRGPAGAGEQDAGTLPPPPAEPAAAPRPAAQGAPWIVVALAVAFGLICLAAGAAAYVSKPADTTQLTADRTSALDAARERTLALTTYDHRTLDQNIAGVLATATGDFRADYEKTTAALKPTFLRTQAVATATVVAAGLEADELDPDGPDTATAVVAVDQVIATAGAQPRTERNRLRMVLVRPEDTWLVTTVERL